jgi:hypothetical protein
MPVLTLPRLAFTKLTRAHTRNPRLARIAFLCVIAVMLLVTSLKYAAKIARPGDSGLQTRSAFLRWRAMIRDLFEGVNVYVGLNEYPNPPVMAIILRPFAELPPVMGAMTWFYAKAAMTVLAVVWTFRLVRTCSISGGMSDAARAGAILIALPAMLGDLTHNNVNLFILFLVSGCLELYRRERDTFAGLVLGLAIACKITPLLLMGYFVWKRAWRCVAGCVLGLVLCLFLIPGLTFGWQQNSQLLGDWYRLMVERPMLKGEVTTEHPNQSLSGIVYRLGTHSPSYIEYVELGPNIKVPTPAAYHNLFDVGRPAAAWLLKGFMGLFVLGVVLLCRADRGDRQGWRFAAECSLIVLGMLLFSERTWKHHAVTLIIPAAVLAHAASLDLRPRRIVLVGLLLAAGLLMTVPGLFGPVVGDLGMVYGTYTWAFLALTTGVVLVLAMNRGRDEECGKDGLCRLRGAEG